MEDDPDHLDEHDLRLLELYSFEAPRSSAWQYPAQGSLMSHAHPIGRDVDDMYIDKLNEMAMEDEQVRWESPSARTKWKRSCILQRHSEVLAEWQTEARLLAEIVGRRWSEEEFEERKLKELKAARVKEKAANKKRKTEEEPKQLRRSKRIRANGHGETATETAQK